jgi:LmbE family N-acetylglucosaminyl deacetylase
LPYPAIAVLLFLLGLALLGVITTGPRAGPSLATVAQAPPAALSIDAQTSLLVVSPHPDDESLCCAGAIQRVLHAGGRVAIVWMTSGDGSELDLLLLERSLWSSKLRDVGLRRMQEARAAATVLGVTVDQQFFLGYPDGELARLLTDHFTTPYRSKWSQQVPYEQALFPGHPYTGQSLEKDFAAVLERVHPTLILAPSPEDSHPDHRASGLLSMRVLKQRGALSSVRYWIVHGEEGWPSPRGLYEGLPLTPPRGAEELAAISLPLTAQEESRKLEAIAAHRTQMQVMSPFLLAFVRTDETYFLRGAPEADSRASER